MTLMNLVRIVCLAVVLPGMSVGLGVDRTFYSGSVLQREVPHPVQGRAEKGESVTVEFAGQSHTATANELGYWTITLDALAADASPSNLIVRAGQHELIVSNIVVGDVWWVCGEPDGSWETAEQGAAESRVPTYFFRDVTTRVAGGRAFVAPDAFARKFSAYTGVPVGLLVARVDRLSPEILERSLGRSIVNPNPMWILPRIPVAGVIWMPGNEDAKDAHRYAEVMPKDVDVWRTALSTPNDVLPVIAIESRESTPFELTFLREAQRKVSVDDEHMGLIATGDLTRDDHDEVAERMMRWATRLVLGDSSVAVSGPIFDAMRVKGRQAILTFTHDRGGLSFVGDKRRLRGLEVASDDRQFYPANAEIRGDALIVTSPRIRYPSAVRYGYGVEIEGGVQNDDGLRMLPFRTDTWKVAGDGRPAVDDPVTVWQVSRPYGLEESTGLGLLDVDLGPETNASKAVWQDIEPDEAGLVDLSAVLGKDGGRASFLRSTISVPEEQDGRLWLGFDEGIRVWLNGNLVYQDQEGKRRAPGSVVIPVHFYQGENTLMLKLPHDKGAWYAYVGVSALADRRIDGFDVKLSR